MKNFNLTQMLQGCSKRNGMTVSASSTYGGQNCNVTQRAELMSEDEKRSENGALSRTCLRSASDALSFRSRYLRYAAMIFCVLAMSVANIGMAWAWDECYYVDGNVGWTSTNVPMGTTSSGNGSCFMYMETNHYFKFRIASKPVGESTNKELTTDGIGVRLYRWDSNDPSAAKYTGNPGIVEVHADQATGDNNYNPWVWLTRPTIYVRHNWNNAGWSNQAMTDNNDGTYTYIGQYSGSNQTNVGPCESCDYGGDYFKYFSSATLTGSPAKGDRCLFTYNSSGFRGYGGNGSNKGSLTITKLCSITYDGNGKTGGAVPTSQTDIVYNTSTTVSGNVGSLVKTGCAFIGWNTAKDGTGKFYLPGSSFTPTATSHTLYAQWLQLHKPGVYESSEGYNKSLKTYSGRKYEIYRYAETSSVISIFAGETSTTTKGDKHCVAQFAMNASSNAKFGGWIMHNGGISSVKSKASDNSAEFSAVSSSKGIKGWGGQGYFIYVSGYDQFDLWAQDKKLASNYYIKVYRDGVDVTANKNESQTVRPYTLDPSLSYLIRIECLGNQDSNGDWLVGFSLRLPPSSCTAPSALAAASPTAKGITLSVTDANDVNNYEFYVSTESTAPEAGATATHSVSSAKSLTITNLVAGTTYYAWARTKCSASNKSTWTALGDGGTFTTSTVNADYHLTNVTKSSGATSGIGGSTFTAVFAAVSGYSMPTPTVTIGGNTATSGTDYTWTAGTGTLTINANKINGDIDITLNSAPSAPSSAVISGTYHYFPGDNISLTCTPSGNNGPTTYQWYKGGKEDGNRIAGATSATYTKNSCAFEDAGSYYCKVTCNATSIWAVTNSHENYDVKILRLYVKGSKNGKDYGNVDFEKVNSTTATASISLGSNWTYGFNIADGCGHYYGNSGTMQENNCTNWTTNVNGTDCGLTTTNAATYIFTINYSSLEAIVTSVTFPVANQAAGKVIYFDNNVLKWTGSSIYYRIGHSSHSQADQLSLVPGTANLYKMTTREYNGFSGWHIANATGDVGSGKSIYKTVDGTPITEATAHEGGAVTESAVTVTPTTSRGNGSDVGINDNCEFYNYTITDGMKTDRVTITAPSNGTITVNYTNTSNVASTLTSGYADLAHTVIITPTATPATGYNLGSLTVNEVAHTSGNTYTVTANTTIAATFTAKTYNITLDRNGASSGSESVTMTYNSSSHTAITAPEKAGYTFDGWYDSETDNNGSGNLVMNASGVLQENVTGFTGAGGIWTKDATCTLYAKWTAAATLYTVTFNSNGGSSVDAIEQASEDASITMPAAPTYSGYTFQGWVIGGTTYAAGASYTPTANITAYASWKENCAGGGGGGTTLFSATHTSSSTMSASTGSVTLSSTSSEQVNNGIKFSADDGYIEATGTSSFATGDVITVRVYNASGSTADRGFKLHNKSGTAHTASIGATSTADIEYTLAAADIESNGKLRILRSNSNVRIQSVTVVRPAGTCFYVTYNGNGAEAGSISDATAYAASGEVTVSSNTGASAFTKSGYHVGSWNTAANGSGTTYALGATFAISGNVTLYAQWVADACSAPSAPTISGTSVRTVGQTIELTAFCESGKDARTTYTWYKGETWGTKSLVQDALTIEEGGRIFNKASCVAGDAGTYWCEASNGPGCASHNATGFAVTVNDAAGDEHIYYYKDADHYVSETGTYYNPEGNTASSGDNKSLSSPWTICNGCKAGVDSVVAHGATYDGKGNHMNAYIKLPTGGNATTKNIKFALTTGYTGTLTMKIGGYENNPTVTLQPLNTSTGVLGDAISYSGTVSGVATTENNFGEITWDLTTPGGTYVLTVTTKTGYISQIDMTTETSAEFNVTYNGNGNTGGTVPEDDDNYASGATVTVAANSGTLVKTNYTGAGWNTANNGTGTNYVPGSGTFKITANTTLYAHWTQLITLAPGTQGTGTNNAAVSWNGSVLRGFAAHTASGYALQGYYTEPSGGTKVLNADGSFAATDIDGFVTSGKWSNTGAAPTLYAQWEASSLLKWNLKVNVSESPITTLSKESAAPTVIAVANMSNLDSTGVTIEASKRSALTSKISTPAEYDADQYVSVQFEVASEYKLIPSDIKVKVQPVSSAKYAKLVLSDESSHEISYTTASKISGGSTQTVTMTNDEEVEFTGTVTLKIYCYGAADKYRLGTPIEINGSVEETCIPPTFSGISYSATEYTVGASASAISVTGAENVTSYLWKQNSVNDRSGGTAASGTNNAPSYTPPTSAADTMYYWCEMTNGCTTVKTAAVGIMVRTATTDPTVTWSNVKLGATDDVTPNYGGGNYVLRATVEETDWTGTLAASMITAPAGITIHHVTTGTADSKKYIEFQFDVTTAFDRASNATIDFNIALPEAGSYSALNSEKSVTYNDCSGGAAGQVAIKMGATASTSKSNPQNYWETAGAGRLMYNYGGNMGSTNNPSGYKTADSTFYYYAASTGQKWMFQTYIGGVNKVRVVFRAAGTIKSSKATITNFYYNTEYFASPGSNAVSFGDVNASKAGYSSGEDGYIEFTVPEMAANSYGAFVTGDGNMKVYGVVLYSENAGSGGSVATNPVWSGGLANEGTVNKTQSDANFTYTISTTTNTLGAISYSSSKPSVAAVDPVTGEVTITATGASAQSAKITATLARSGCYQGATRTYIINVAGYSCSEPSGSVELTSGSATKCASESVTLTMTGFTEEASIQWYNGDSPISNGGGYTITTTATQSTLTTTAAGTYSAIATVAEGCVSGAKRTNSITIANMDMSEQKTVRKVSQWYVKNGRLTPDIALWQLGEGERFKSVAWSSSNGTGLDFVTRNGIVYLEGKEPSTNTSGADIPYTLTLTITDACGTDHVLSGQTIKLTHQKNTDKHVLAFVVNGTAKGGFTEGITAAQTTSVGLYNAIAAQFDVQATNIYSTDDEQKLREYYSQYDILCITDYPNTQTKGVNSKSYVDAIGALIDIRPILTMEAFVSSLSNWKLKGVSGNPKSPSTRQYTMLLQCKDHEIFSGTKLTKVGEGEDAMYRVTMVDKNQEEYKTLDANYGDGEHKANEGYQYGKKPALQGFTYTEEMSENDLLPLGLIDDGAGNDLQVGIERQKEMSARMMVLGINSYAMERLDKDGEAIVINALKYLMKKSAEDISDCSVYFDGSDKTDPTNWDNELNWGPSYASLPLPHQEVRILKECVVKDGVVARASGIKIIPRGRINHDTDDASGSLTIEPGGALIVDGKVRAAEAPNYFTAIPTTPANLYIAADEMNGNGTLIFDNEDGETQATVGYYSKATTDENTTWNWQYMAVPFNDNSSAYRNFYDSYLYRWAENCSGWEVVPNQGAVYPWVGYTITQVGAKTYYMDGTLVETGEQTFTVPAGADLVLGNSWTAPLQVKQFEDDDFDGLEKKVYLFNTGYDYDKTGTLYEDGATHYEAGTYVVVPIHSSPYTGDSLISSLQAFTVTSADGEGTLTLDYERHVRPARSTDEVNAGPMHAPRRAAAREDKPTVLKIWASGNRFDDRLVVLEREDFSTGSDDGWDGEKVLMGEMAPTIYTVMENGYESVTATNDYEGTLIGFKAGEDNEYTFRFEYDDDAEAVYLLDTDERMYVRILTGTTYTFTCADKSEHNRFLLTRKAPEIATGCEPIDGGGGPKATKFIKDNKLYILLNGVLYDATGKVVK